VQSMGTKQERLVAFRCWYKHDVAAQPRCTCMHTWYLRFSKTATFKSACMQYANGDSDCSYCTKACMQARLSGTDLELAFVVSHLRHWRAGGVFGASIWLREVRLQAATTQDLACDNCSYQHFCLIRRAFLTCLRCCFVGRR
jgi:hypothetical protein